MGEYDVFSKMSKVRATEGGKYIPPGMHIFEIDACKLIKGFKGKSFIVELTTLETKSPDSVKPSDRLSVGEGCSWVINLDKPEKIDLSLGNIKQFLGACFPDDDMDDTFSEANAPAAMATICGEKNPLHKHRIQCEAWNKPTQAGKDFTRVKWITLEDAASAA